MIIIMKTMYSKTDYKVKQGQNMRTWRHVTDVRIKNICCKHITNFDNDDGKKYDDTDNSVHLKWWQNP